MKTVEASFRRFIFVVVLWNIAGFSAFAKDFHSPLIVSFSPNSTALAVSDATNPAVSLIDPATHKITVKIPLTGKPEGLAWSADGKRIFASQTGAGSIAEIDASSGKITRRFTTGRYPSGLAFVAERGLLVACDRGLDRLTVLDSANGNTIAHIPVGRQPMNVAVSPDGSLAVVSNLIPATAATAPDHATEVTLVDLTKMAVRASVRLPTGSTNARGVAIDAGGRTAYVVHTLGRYHLPTTQLDRGWVNTNALSVIDLPSATRRATVLLDQVVEGAADPWGIAIEPNGARIFITHSGVHQLAVIDRAKLTAIIGSDPYAFTNDLSALHREGIMRRVDLPAKGPRGVDISADGTQLAVAGYFSGGIVLLDKDAAQPAAVPLGPPMEPDPARRGEISFHDAGRCFQRWLSCATCHADARADGLNWDLLNDGIGNPKNSRSMLLSHVTPPVMSLGVRDSMETAVRSGFIHIQFTQPESGEVEAVSAYLSSLKPEISPYRLPDGSLSEAALRGEKIFHSKSVGCAQCHPAPLYTNLKLKDVGTATQLDRGQTQYDVPTLVELWRTPPYLHDGRATTLREVLTDHNPDDDHGNTSSLKPAEIDDLVQYLLSL
jgi:DNA-binding beta-propeller fold protein YncE/mono/diheme cytochrome c family protein